MRTSSLTPQERSLRASAAAHTLHSKVDSREHLLPALAASPARLAYFERQVDPHGVLSEAERARRAEHARSAYYADLTRQSIAARRRSTK
jgi:hypothetical protein